MAFCLPARQFKSVLFPLLGLRGAGYFFAAGEPEPGTVEPRIASLRERIRAERGKSWLAARIAVVARALDELDPAAFPGPATQPSADRLPRRGAHLSERLVELTLQHAVVFVLRPRFFKAPHEVTSQEIDRTREDLRTLARRLRRDVGLSWWRS